MKNKTTAILCAAALAISAAAQPLPSSWDLYPATTIADRSLAFDTDAEGVSLPILWGFDTAWNDEANMLRGVRYTGSDIIGVARVSFQPWAEITEKGVLPPMLQENLDKRMKTVGIIGHKVDIALNLDGGEPTIKEIYGGLDADNNYIGNPADVADAYARLIDATAAAVQAQGYKVVSAAPLNEPDYYWNGTPINVFNEINRRLKNFDEYPRFADIRISGGNTLNCDQALPWYSELKEYLDEGNTHQLAGDFDHYADFFTTVRADGKYATADELHNVMEAMVGMEYGMQTGIWWGTAEQARGEFCKASGGQRLAYAENRKAWSSAAVYRAPSGRIQGFAGCSERQAMPSTFRFVSLSGDVFVDGKGPLREYTLSIPGDDTPGAYQTEKHRNAETVLNITYGDDVQPAVDGQYARVNAASHLVLGGRNASTANTSRIEQQAYSAGSHQIWTVQPVPNDIGGDFSYYFIRNSADGQALDNLNWNLNPGGEVIAFGPSNSSVQQWALEYDGDGWFHIRNKFSALYLEVADNAAGTLVLQHERRDDSSQRWRLLPKGAALEFDAPDTPTGLKAEIRSASIALSWNPVTDATALYTVLRAEEGSESYNTIARGLVSTEFLDNSIICGKEYSYKLIAVDASLNRSTASGTVSAKAESSGLIAYYEFNDNTNDSSENGFNAHTLVSPMFTAGFTEGSRALRMRANQHLQLPYSLLQQSEQFTVAIRARRTSPTDGLHIFNTGTGEDNCLYLSLCENGLTKLAAVNNGRHGEITAPAAPENEWIHLAAVVDGDKATLYIDGTAVSAASDALAGCIPADRMLTYIGRTQNPALPLFMGFIDDLNIYNKALDADEVALLAAGNSGVTEITDTRSIVSTEYFDTRGMRLAAPATDGSVTIIRSTRSDGSVEITKKSYCL